MTTTRRIIHLCWLALLAGALAGCAAPPRAGGEVQEKINEVLLKSAAERKAPPAEVTDKSLMPPLAPQLAADTAAAEPRFDLSVVNAPATQVFMALVSGTRYSMLLPPDVSGSLTVNLKDVTVLEALDTIRELYGYEYRLQGKRIFIEPNTMKSRVFQINYLSSQRQGSSVLRVTGSSINSGGTTTSGGSAATPVAGQTVPAGTGTPTAASGGDTSRVSMTSVSDFWGDLSRALTTIVGAADGRNVVVNPSSGVVLVRALPNELRNVEKYLKATQLIAERQVMLEAKIIDVTLAEDFQAGINWGAFRSGPNSHLGLGIAQPGATLSAGAAAVTQTLGTATAPVVSVTPGQLGAIAASTLGKGFIGLAFQTSNFAALLNFLETQGNVSVLSSPRIATLNNQKAVLKVGDDGIFVTNLTVSAGTTTAAGVTGPATITPQFQSMFSGISLDVTPQIDDDINIILHVHPAITSITESNKVIDLGGATGVINLPLAVSRINETDSVVRVQNGNIVAIGGLMRQEQSSDRSQLPGASGFFANALGQRAATLRKRELVILIKPTLIDGDRAWAQDLKDVQERVRAYPSGETVR